MQEILNDQMRYNKKLTRKLMNAKCQRKCMIPKYMACWCIHNILYNSLIVILTL